MTISIQKNKHGVRGFGKAHVYLLESRESLGLVHSQARLWASEFTLFLILDIYFCQTVKTLEVLDQEYIF